ncbi:hypothetical protein L7F22_005332 [Adiantum nelumboides]|nr:hypothetical protein [Adiantum nelumboides]
MIEKNNQPRKASSGGSVLVDKVLEPLDALLQAWEAKLNNNQTLEQRWLTYPYPEIETKRLEMCKELIKAAHALMEPNVVRAPKNEVLIHKDLEKQGDKEPEPVTGPKPETNLSLDHRMVPNTTDEAMTIEVMPVPEVEEPWPQSLWENIRNKKDESATLQSAPIPEIVLNNEFYPGNIQSLYGDAGIEISMDSKPQSLKTLPSFIGEREAKSEIRIVPSQQRATPKMIDSKGLQEMLSTPVTLQMASVILESGSESDENEKSTRRVECKRIVDEISVIDIEKRTDDEFMDSLSKDLSLLDEDFPIIEADDERSSESESECKSIPQPEKFYDFSNQKPRRQERYRQRRSRRSKGKQDKPMPFVKDKTTYLRFVKANDCYKDVFAWSYKDLKGVDPSICQHTIPLKRDAKPSKQRPYTYNETFARKIKEEIDKLKEGEFIYEIEHTDWVSPIVVVPKKNGKLRVCVNLKKVNAATIRDNYPLPITDHVIERVAGREAYSFLDGFSGYNKLAIKSEDQHKTAFATEWGIFAYRVMPFGLTNAPTTFQRLMSHAFKEYLRQFLEIYMDDLYVHSLIRMDHIEHLTKIFEKCRLYQIFLNPEKCVFMVRQGKILGHIVSKNGISTDMEKILVIVELPRPLRVKEVQAFMGHCGYYRRFIYLYAIIAKPLYVLITKFEWTDECDKAFQILKQRLISAPVLKAPDWDKIFHVHVDASAFAIGCILAQPGEKNMDFPISYSRRQLNNAEKNYTTTEREGLGMIYAVKKFRHYLLSNKFVLFVDHQALLYLVNKPCSTGRIVRWFIILLEFDFTMIVKKGTTHQRADHLSRLMHGEALTGIDDDLPDAYLFNIDMVPRWSEELIPLLSVGSLHMTKQPSIIGASRSLVMLADRLYKQGTD